MFFFSRNFFVISYNVRRPHFLSLVFFVFIILSGMLISCSQEVVFSHEIETYVSFNGRDYFELQPNKF